MPQDPPFMVVDLHVDLPWQVHYKHRPRTLAEGHATLRTLAEGGYGGLVFPIYLPDAAPGRRASTIEDADAVFATIEGLIREHDLFLPLTARAAEPGKISTFLSIEGAGAFASDISQIDRFIARGLRLVSPCHGKNSGLASSATGEKVKFGLTPLGKQFCERVYAQGALIDVSHVSDASFADIAEIARAHGAPVVATHSDARAIANQPRNLTDEELRVIAETGGVAGINFHAQFVSGTKDATLADVVKQVEYMVRVAGVSHVAVGTDFDGGIETPEGLGDASTLPTLAAALRARGMSYDDVLAILFAQRAPRPGLAPAGHRAAQASAGRRRRRPRTRLAGHTPGARRRRKDPAMNELHTRCLDLFPEWLRALAADAVELSKVLGQSTMPETTRRYVAGGLNYLFKSLDLDPRRDRGPRLPRRRLRRPRRRRALPARGPQVRRGGADPRAPRRRHEAGGGAPRQQGLRAPRGIRPDAHPRLRAGAQRRRHHEGRWPARRLPPRGERLGGELRDAELLPRREEPGEAPVVPRRQAARVNALVGVS